MPHEHPPVAGEHPRGHQIQIIVFIFFFCIWILDSFILRITAFIWSLPFFFTAIVELYEILFTFSYLTSIIPGVVIILLGIFLMQRSHIVFEVKEPKVVDYGIYSHVRHPMYLGAILIYVGFWVTTLSLLSLIPLLIIFLSHNYLSNTEEKLLEAKFGDQYREYKKRVPKFIPH